MKNRKTIIFASAVVICLLVALIASLFYGAYSATHLPRQKILKTPADYGLVYENIEFLSTDGIKLKGWWLKNPSSDSVIVVTHGYGANRAGWLGKNKNGEEEYIDWLAGSVPLYKAGHSLLLFDFRASGESEGDTITMGFREVNDLKGAIQWVLSNEKGTDKDPVGKIGVLGFSMGGNVALRGGIYLKNLLKENKIRAAAVVAIGPSIYDTMIRKSFQYWAKVPAPDLIAPMFKVANGLLLGINVSKELDPTKYVGEISPVPVMYIQSEKDEIGDVSDVLAMFEKTGEPKELIILPDASRFEHYKYPAKHPEKVADFFNRHLYN